MSDTGTLYDILRSIAPPPCEKFRCGDFNKCATELLACRAFQFYTTTGRSVDPYGQKNDAPTHAMYKRIYVVKQEDASDETHD